MSEQTNVLEVYSFSGLTHLKIPMPAQMEWPIVPADDSFYNLHLAYVNGLHMMGYVDNETLSDLYDMDRDSFYLELPHQRSQQTVESEKPFASWAIFLVLGGKPHVIFCPQLHDLLVFQREYAETIRLVRY